MEIRSTSSQVQSVVPVTFGQPFRAGDWNHTITDLVATDNLGNSVPLQADDISSHRDGTARFAVLSTELVNLAAGGSESDKYFYWNKQRS